MTFKKTIAALALVGALGVVIATGLAAQADDPKPVAAAARTAPKMEAPRDFSDWRLLCTVPDKAGRKNCNMIQRIAREKNDKQAVFMTTVRIGKLKDKPVTWVNLVTPLGTVLRAGVALKIDDDKQMTVPYEQCLPGGCRVTMAFEKDMSDKLRGGKALFVAYKAPNGKTNTVKVSLKGFAQALDAMSQAEKG